MNQKKEHTKNNKSSYYIIRSFRTLNACSSYSFTSTFRTSCALCHCFCYLFFFFLKKNSVISCSLFYLIVHYICSIYLLMLPFWIFLLQEMYGHRRRKKQSKHKTTTEKKSTHIKQIQNQNDTKQSKSTPIKL